MPHVCHQLLLEKLALIKLKLLKFQKAHKAVLANVHAGAGYPKLPPERMACRFRFVPAYSPSSTYATRGVSAHPAWSGYTNRVGFVNPIRTGRMHDTCRNSVFPARHGRLAAEPALQEAPPSPAPIPAEVPGVGVVVFLIKGRTVLLGKRRQCDVGDGAFCLPGGHLEFGESFEECGMREVKEETGLNIKNLEFLHITNNIWMDKSKCSHYVVVVMRSSSFEMGIVTQEVKNMESEKCEGWDWYDWDNLPSPLVEPLDLIVRNGFTPF